MPLYNSSIWARAVIWTTSIIVSCICLSVFSPSNAWGVETTPTVDSTLVHDSANMASENAVQYTAGTDSENSPTTANHTSSVSSDNTIASTSEIIESRENEALGENGSTDAGTVENTQTDTDNTTDDDNTFVEKHSQSLAPESDPTQQPLENSTNNSTAGDGSDDSGNATHSPTEQTGAYKEASASADTPEHALALFAAARSSNTSATAGTGELVIALDPGHGGYDPGATNGSLHEANITLQIANYCKEALENYANVRVFLTRTDDTYVGLVDRVNRAVNGGANVFVSIHINASGSTGVEVYVQNASSYNYGLHTESYGLGKEVLNQLVALGWKNRGVQTRNSSETRYPDGSIADYLSVLRNSRLNGLPAILIEHGFIDNSHDAALLRQASVLKDFGKADAKGIALYYGLNASPIPTATSMKNGQMTLAWNAVKNATKYAIAQKLPSGSYCTYDYDCTATTYTVTGLENGVAYSFLVQAFVNGRWSSFTDANLYTVVLAPSPTGVTATPAGDGIVSLSWTAVPKATRYAVAEKLSDGSYRTFTYKCEGTSLTVADLANGVRHLFLVQANVGGSWSPVSDDLLVACTPQGTVKPAPEAEAGDGKATLSWSRVPGADRYAVAVKLSDGSYRTYDYDCTATTYTVTGLANGATYRFLVQSHAAGRWSAFSDADLVVCVPAAVPSPQDVKATPAGDGIVSLSWTAVPKATRYAVAEKLSDGSYRTFTYKCEGTSLTVADLANGVRHLFLVQANVGGSWSPVSDDLLVACTPQGTVKPAPEAEAGDGKATLSWSRVPGADRYAVAVKLSDGSYRTYDYDCTATTYTVTGLANGATYRFLVQSHAAGRWSAFSDADLVVCVPAARPSKTVDGGDTGYEIMGSSTYTAEQFVSAFASRNKTYPASEFAEKGASTIQEFCKALIAEAAAESVKAEVVFAQAMLETGWLQFGGDVSADQCNFAGIGATGNGASGATFSNVAEGLRAQVQHLKAYASTSALNQGCVDPRFEYVTRGCAPTVQELSGKWSVDESYGSNIMKIIATL